MTAATVEIWLRTKGARRQAFYRLGKDASWKGMAVSKADKALRDGTVSIGGMNGLHVVSRETSKQEHPGAAAFHAAAVLLSQQIDTINAGTAP